MGKSVAGKRRLAAYTQGMRTSVIETMLCRNEMPDFPQAQKYPLNEKCTPAKMQSKIYPRIYCPPAVITSASDVNSPTTGSAINCASTLTAMPKPTAMHAA